MNKISIITHSVRLTIKQVEEVMSYFQSVYCEILETQNDDDRPEELPHFTSIELESSSDIIFDVVLSGRADLAIHSANDFPYPLPIDLDVIALIDLPNNTDCDNITGSTHPLQNKFALVAKKENDLLRKLFISFDCRKKYGKVYIAGYGPGDPELLTIKAQKALERADVIFYDCLLDESYLENFKAEKISVGKRKNQHLKEQEEINELLYEAAVNGKLVVRIKGGDPLIFGRGGEEFLYLKKRFIDAEIIPGITSALAAGALSGIPLTQRRISSSVSFCTGHPESSIHIPNTETIAFYMSASSLGIIINKLLEYGRSCETPIALIENISLPKQRITIGTLNDILQKSEGFHSPLLIIVGNTVKLNHYIKNSASGSLVSDTFAEELNCFDDKVHTLLH